MSEISVNSIYILSKGRPECLTARILTDIKYTGRWHIVCGNDDITLEQYKKNWRDRVIVFDIDEQLSKCDFIDNFGIDFKFYGGVPVRNAIIKISRQNGEKRHWQFDDDYNSFYIIDKNFKKWHKLNGKELEFELNKLAMFAYTGNLSNIGFALSSETMPQVVKSKSSRVFNTHNISNDLELNVTWRSRMNGDVINAIDTFRSGRYEMCVKYLKLQMDETQRGDGGNSLLYKELGTVRKTAYPIIVDPLNVKLIIKFGRHHHAVNWKGIAPKLIHEKFKYQQ